MVATLVAMAFTSQAQSYGLDTRPATGAFLNGVLPPQEQSASGWQAVVAFPNLTFDDPVCFTPEPRTNRLYVCCRQGPIYFFTNDQATTNKTLFLDLTPVNQGWDDCGVLGFAFHPEYGVPGSPNRGYVYVWYQYSPSPNPFPLETTLSYNRLSRFTVPDGSLIADPNSEVVLINQFDRSTWHNGGGMFFGPDGYLYLSVGDEGSAENLLGNAQRIDLGLFSGVLRIDVDMNPVTSHPIRRQPQSAGTPPIGWPGTYSGNYYIPNDNPWQDTNGAVLEEFYAIGLRSPHRMTYDPPTGNIWLGDVGQAACEEVDLIKKGCNYQWAYMEGTLPGFDPMPNPLIGVDTPPIYGYPHASGNNCVIGGYVYRGVQNAAYLSGSYIFGDNGSSRVWAMTYDGSGTPQVTNLCAAPGSAGTGTSSFGLDQNGEIYICQMGQGAQLYQLARAGTQGQAPPALLSQTGVFTNLASLAPNAALIPYTVNTPLWSDGAVKSRWMAVPNDTGQTIGFSTNGYWSFPTGTVLIKHFELPINQTNASVRKRLETRFLIHGTNGNWFGLTYKWRADNSDADLLPGSLNETNLITTPTGVQTQVWYYPSRQDCQLCHNQNAGQVLGLRTCQMNGSFNYPSTGRTDNQLRTLNHLGMFSPALVETNIPTYPQSVSITNTSADLTLRVRSYLDANCAQCHRPNGVSQAFFDARLDTPLASQGIVEGNVGDNLGISGAKVVAPASLAQSIMYLRMNTTDTIKMPPLARNLVDTQAVSVLAQWINSLPPITPPPSPWSHQDVGNVGIAGDATYSAGTFTLTASGVDIWDVADSFHFVYQPLVGDAVITARVATLNSVDGGTLAGVMIRQDLTAGSAEAFGGVTLSQGVGFTRRLISGNTSVFTSGDNATAPYWIRLVRTGATFNCYDSADGVAWTLIDTDTISMTGTVYVGLAYCSHNNNTLGTASFDNVLLTGPNVNNPPVAGPDTVTRWMSQGVVVPAATLLTNDTDVDGDPLSLTSVAPLSMAGGTVTLSNTWVSYWPLFGYTNTDNFTYVVSDGRGASATGLVTVAVIPDPAGSDLLGFQTGTGGSYVVLLTGIAGFTYTVQYCTALGSSSWQNLAVVTADGLGHLQITDTPPANSPTRFYRAVRGIAP
ncbi:MAG: PQQ-dependent sugar dehydrogenase [Verrucomicrobiia bacterium]